MSKYFLRFFFVFYVIVPAFAQQKEDRIGKIAPTFPTIDSIYKDFAAKMHFPGLTYAVMLDGEIIHSGMTGRANLADNIPATLSTAFRIASMSKSFAAMAILQLRDKGELKLDDPIHIYVPYMRNSPQLSKDAPAITIRNLLTHTAGFPEDNPWGDRQLAVSEDELIGLVRDGIAFSNVSDQTYEYSNLGFALLGYIISQVGEKPYQQYIKENIWDVLGMKHTYWEYTEVPKDRLALGYRWINEQWVEQPQEHDGAYGAMGGIITTMEDFAKYVAFHQSAWPASDEPEQAPLKRSSVREMHRSWSIPNLNANYIYPSGNKCPIVSSYGYGLGWSKDCEGRVMVGHSGGLPGFGSNWRMMPDYGLAIVSFANLTYAPASYINTHVLETVLHKSKIKPTPIPVSPILNQRKSEIIEMLPNWDGAESKGIFADNFFLDYFTETLRKEARTAFEKAGKILRIEEIIPENNLRGTFVMEGEKANISVYFTLTPERNPLIQEYHLTVINK